MTDQGRLNDTITRLQALGGAARRTVTRLRTLASREMPALPLPSTPAERTGLLQLVPISVCILAIALLLAANSACAGARHLQDGIRAFNAGDTNKAIEELTGSILSNKSIALAYQYRAMAYARKGDYTRATDDFTHVVAMQPRNVDALTGRACQYLRAQNYVLACNDLDSALKISSDLPEVYRLRAYAESKRGEFSLASADCRLLLSRFGDRLSNQDRLKTLKLLSVALKESGKVAEAIAACSQAIALQPRDADLYQTRALLLQKQHHWQEAAADFSRAIQFRVDAPLLCQRARCYEEAGHNLSAMEDLNQAIKLSSHDLVALRQRAALALKMGDYHLAAADLKSVLDQEPGNPQAESQYEHACKLAAGGHQSAARVTSVQAADSDRIAQTFSNEDPGTLTTKGYELLKAGDAPDAVTALSMVVRKQPENARARKYLAHALLACGKAADAADQFQLISSMASLSSEDLLAMAQALDQAGYTEKAIKRYEDCVFIHPENIAARVALVKAYLRAGQSAKALETARDGMHHARSASDIALLQHAMLEAGAGAVSK